MYKARWSVVAVTMCSAVIGATHVGKLAPASPNLRANLVLDLVRGRWVAIVFALNGLMPEIASRFVGDRFAAAGTPLTVLSYRART